MCCRLYGGFYCIWMGLFCFSGVLCVVVWPFLLCVGVVYMVVCPILLCVKVFKGILFIMFFIWRVFFYWWGVACSWFFWPICMYLVFWSVNFSFIYCCLCVGIISSVGVLCFWFVVCLFMFFFCFVFIFVLFVFFLFISPLFRIVFFSHVVFLFRIFLDFSSSFLQFFSIVLLGMVVFL